MMLNNMKRVSFSVLLLISTFTFPWWVSFTAAILGAFYFKNLFEIILVGFIIDILYGPTHLFFEFDLFFTIILLVIFYVIDTLKEKY